MENLAELEALATSTDAKSNEIQQASIPVDPNAPPEPPGREEQARDMVNAFVGLAAGYAPEVQNHWPEAQIQASAAVIAPLLEKYNFSLTNIPPELMAIIVLGPPLYQTAKVIARKIESDRRQEKAVPAQKHEEQMTVTPDTPTHEQMGLYPT